MYQFIHEIAQIELKSWLKVIAILILFFGAETAFCWFATRLVKFNKDESESE